MYICGGSNVYPAEVEQVIARVDGVAEVAVIGIPDERLGEVGAPSSPRARVSTSIPTRCWPMPASTWRTSRSRARW